MSDAFFVVFGSVLIFGCIVGSMRVGYYKGKGEMIELYSEEIDEFSVETERLRGLVRELGRSGGCPSTRQEESSWI